MADIVKIVIESESSGLCEDGEEWSDKLTIDRDSIKYEFDGFILTTRMPGNWSYKTNSPVFQKLFTEAAAAVEEIINREENRQVYDAPPIAFAVIYADKSEATRFFFRPARDTFKECFAIIKKMVPGCEETPWGIMTSEDYKEEDYEDEDFEDEDDEEEEWDA